MIGVVDDAMIGMRGLGGRVHILELGDVGAGGESFGRGAADHEDLDLGIVGDLGGKRRDPSHMARSSALRLAGRFSTSCAIAPSIVR